MITEGKKDKVSIAFVRGYALRHYVATREDMGPRGTTPTAMSRVVGDISGSSR